MPNDIAITIAASAPGVTQLFGDIADGARRTKDAVRELGTMQGLDGFVGRVKEAKNEMSNLYDVADGAKGLGQKMFLGGAAAGGALIAGVKTSLDSFGEMQQVEAGLTSMLGSPEAAKAKIKEIQDFAKNSPFDFSESAKASQKLLAMGFSGSEIVPILNKVGNAVAAAGGDTEAFSGVLTALGQIKTKGKLSQEEINQISERGISVQFLADKLGLSAKEMGNLGNAGVEADKGISALLAGFSEIGGGKAMDEQMKTIPGQVSSLGDSLGQLEASFGKVFSEDASKLVSSLDGLLQKTKEFVDKNPELTKTIATIAGVGIGGAVVGGGALMIGGGIAKGIMDIKALIGAYKGSKGAAKDAADAKDGLVAATLKDINAEKLKAGIANTEASAIGGVGVASLSAAEAKNQLASATEREAKLAAARGTIEDKLSKAQARKANAAPGSDEAKAADAEISMLRKARNKVKDELDVAKDAVKDGANDSGGALGGLGGAALSALTGDTDAAVDAIKDKFSELAEGKLDEFMDDPIEAMKTWKGQAMSAVSSVRSTLASPLLLPGRGAINLPSILGTGGGQLSMGALAFGAANGALAGRAVNDDMGALGYSQGEAMTAAVATGLGTAVITAMNPPAGLLILAATALREGVNQFVNKPMEAEAERGSGLNDEEAAAMSGKSHTQQAEQYEALAARKRQERNDLDSTWGWQPEISRQKGALDLDIQGADAAAAQQRRLEKQRNTPDQFGNTIAWDESNAAWQKKVNAGRVGAAPKEFSSVPGRDSVQVLKEGDVKINVAVSRTATRLERDADDYQRRR